MDTCVYRPRRPAETPLYGLLESLFETVKGAWEDLFERRYGFWRGLLDGVVARYLDCGIFERGFARIRCPDCAAEFLLAFSCKGRGLCPSCGAKRAALPPRRTPCGLGRERRVRTSVPTFLLAPAMLEAEDLLAVLSRHLLTRHAATLRLHPPPLDIPSFDVVVVWHSRVQDDPAHRWLRGRLAQTARKLG